MGFPLLECTCAPYLLNASKCLNASYLLNTSMPPTSSPDTNVPGILKKRKGNIAVQVNLFTHLNF